jgi:diguanylate cyclase (GGDEF)-like protein
VIQKSRLYLPILAMIFLFIAAGFIFHKQIKGAFVEFVLHELEIEIDNVTHSMSLAVPSFETESVIEYLHGIPFAERRQRFSLIDIEGTVIADSSLSRVQLVRISNHAERPEFIGALKNGIGSHVRLSQTKGVEYIYLAKPFYAQNFTGIARLAMPLEYVDKTINSFMMTFISVVIMTLGVVITFTIINNKMIAIRIDKREHLYQSQFSNQKRDIELLHRLASLLAACNSAAEAQLVVIDVVPKILGDVEGVVAIMRSSRNLLEIKLNWGGNSISSDSYSPDDCWALRKGKYHFAKDELTNMQCKHMLDCGHEQTLCIPMIAHGEAIGMMSLAFKTEEIDDKTRNLCFTIAEHIGLAMANLELKDKLRQQALRDPLTGLYNRRYLESSLEQALLLSRRSKESLSMMMIDMDHFKRFNDNFGHDAGDYVLKQLASVLLKACSNDESVCRVGGEEIAILLPKMDEDTSICFAKDLCSKVRAMNPKFNGQVLGQLTISIGIATYPNSADTGETLIKQADIALYQAKNTGRDRAIHVATIEA